MTGMAQKNSATASRSRFERFKNRHRKSFIVDIDGALMRRHELLSKGARRLYGTMRALGDGKTGKLIVNGHPLDWRYICREAEIGRDCWRMWYKELVAAGLAGCDRPRRTIPTGGDGQRRNVLGRATYFVYRQAIVPKNVKNSRILLKPDFPTVEESGPQRSQTHPGAGVRSGVSGFGCGSVSGSEARNHHHQAAPNPKPDDDSSRAFPKTTTEATPQERYAERLDNLVETTLRKWKAKLTGLEYVMVEIAIERILERSRRAIVSTNYLDRAIENFFLDEEERADVLWAANRRICLRDKWMPDFDFTAYSDQPDPKLASLLGGEA